MDLPGHGQSDPVPGDPTIADFAQAAQALLKALNLATVCALGHHTGAQVATELALGWPNCVDRLILNGPLPMSAKERSDGLAYVETQEKGMVFEPDCSHLTRLFENRNAYASDATDWRKATRYVAEAFMGLGPLWHGHYAAFTHDHGAAIAQLACPALILTNSGDALYSHAQATKALRPDFDYAELAGGGVDIVDEAPKAWVKAVADFVSARDSKRLA